jgi:peroxiredoxin
MIDGSNVAEAVRQEITDALNALKAKGFAPGIKVGEKAPGFRLPDSLGREVSLKQRLKEGPVVLSFYRGEWCPFCNLELKALQDDLPRIKKAGASLIAISPQTSDNALSLREKLSLEFDLLSDETQKAIREYKLQFEVPSELKGIYAGVFGLDVANENADGSWNLPVPATFVLDRGGIVHARHVSMNYMVRMEPDAVIDALVSLG